MGGHEALGKGGGGSGGAFVGRRPDASAVVPAEVLLGELELEEPDRVAAMSLARLRTCSRCSVWQPPELRR